MTKDWKASKGEIWYKMLEKIEENLNFVSSNFIRGITCSHAFWCKFTENTRGGVLL